MNLARADVYVKVCSYYRTVASTNMNDVSSRSHAIFTILFTQVGKQTCVTESLYVKPPPIEEY